MKKGEIVCKSEKHIRIDTTMSGDTLKLFSFQKGIGCHDTYMTFKEGERLLEELKSLLKSSKPQAPRKSQDKICKFKGKCVHKGDKFNTKGVR